MYVNNLKLYVSEAYLSRNFSLRMESDQNRDTDLVFHVTVFEHNQRSILFDFKLKNIYVINGDKIWIKNSEEIRAENGVSQAPYFLRGINVNGPKWDIDTFVDVVCEIQESASGKSYLIISKNNKIRKIS